MSSPVEAETATRITVPYRVRFDECGPDGLVRTSALLRYAQDVAWIHSERLGFDRPWYAARNLAWVVRAVELEVREPVPLGATLQVTTAVVGFRKVWARRRTEARTADGSLAMWAHTDWVMTDGRGMPARVPPEFPARFAAPPGSFEPGRIALPAAPAGAHVYDVLVRPQDLDPMGHVNNAAYVDYLDECLLAAGAETSRLVVALPRTVGLEYVAPATPGATLRGSTWAEERALDRPVPGWAWRLAGDEGRDIVRGRVETSSAGDPAARTQATRPPEARESA